MSRILRRVLAVLVGAAVAVLVVVLFDTLSARLFPLPPATDVRDPESLRTAIAAMPLSALVLLLAGWGIAAGVGAFVAVRLTPERRVATGVLVAALLLLATLGNLAMLPHPLWMWPAAVVLLPTFGWLGARAGSSRRARVTLLRRAA